MAIHYAALNGSEVLLQKLIDIATQEKQLGTVINEPDKVTFNVKIIAKVSIFSIAHCMCWWKFGLCKDSCRKWCLY